MLLKMLSCFIVSAVYFLGLSPVGAFAPVPGSSHSPTNVVYASGGDGSQSASPDKEEMLGEKSSQRLRQHLMSKVTEPPKDTVVSIPKYIDDLSNVKRALEEADVVVIRQEDGKIFSHGLNLVSGDPGYLSRSLESFIELVTVMEKSNAIIIAVIDGEVRGGGMMFPAMADIVIATNEGSFGLPEVRVGMIPSIVSRCLVERMGKAAVRQLSLTCETISAKEAQRMGLVDRVVDKRDLEAHLQGLTRRWKRSKDAILVVKSELLPKDPTHAEAMGTVLGQWLKDAPKISDRNPLEYEITEDGVAILTMKDLKSRNTFSDEMTRSIRELIPVIKRDSKAIILCSGLDNFHLGINPFRVRDMSSAPIHEVAAYLKEQYIGFVELTSLGIPVIAVLNGKVAGGGLPISLWCDYRIATEDVDVSFGNLSRGMSPAGQLSKLLNVFLSPTAIMDSYLTNSNWNSTELLDLGIVNHVCADREEALIRAQSLASFISKNPQAGVRDTLDLVKTKYNADVCNKEAWKIAKKITSNDTFQSCKAAVLNQSWKAPQRRLEHETPERESNVPVKMGDDYEVRNPSKATNEYGNKIPERRQKKPCDSPRIKANIQASSFRDDEADPAIGIVAMEAYIPAHSITVDVLEANGIEAKSDGQKSVSVWDSQEDSVSLALNAVSRLLENHVSDPYSIGRLEVGTESNLDMSISIKSYLMTLFPSDHMDVEGVDNTNACYGGVAALLNSIAWCRETGRYAIVVATDTADYPIENSGWRGAGAVAMLVGPNPWIEIHSERASRFLHTDDFYNPRWKTNRGPIMDNKMSATHYFDSLSYTIKEMSERYGIDTYKADAVLFHGGTCGKFMRMVEYKLLKKAPKKTRQNWKLYFDAHRKAATHIGSVYTSSLFLNLMSLLSFESVGDLRKIMLFGYGSGSSATLMHATIHQERAHNLTILSQIDDRSNASFEQHTQTASGPADKPTSLLQRQIGCFYRDLSAEKYRRYDVASFTSPQKLISQASDTDLPSTTEFAPMENWSKEVEMKDLLEKFDSNLWVVSEKQLEENLEQWTELAGGRDRIWYPVKANPSPAILEVLARKGACAECASESELLLARRSGFPSERLIYHSPALDVSLAVKLLEQGSNVVVNSKSILSKLDKELVDHDFDDPGSGIVLVRVNPSIDIAYKEQRDDTHLTSHAAPNSKFGIPSEEVVHALQRTKNIRISGLHVHVGTQMDCIKPFVEAKAHMIEIASQIKRLTIHEPKILNLGGGLGIPYNEKEKYPSISELSMSLREADCGEDFTYWYEPGQALVGNAVGLLGSILTKETMRGRKFAIADIGSDNLLVNSLLGYTHSILGANGQRLPCTGKDKIAGPLCFAGDVLLHGTDISSIDEGDPIFVQHVGAYRGSIASTFNGRRSGGTVIVRKDGTYAQACPPASIDSQNEALARDYRWGLMRYDLSSYSPRLFETEGRSSDVLTNPGGDVFTYESAIQLSPTSFEFVINSSDSAALFCNGGLLVKMAGDAGIVSLMEMLDVKTKDFSVFATEFNMKLSGLVLSKKPVSLLIRISNINAIPGKRSYEAAFHYSFNRGKTEGTMTIEFDPGQNEIPLFAENGDKVEYSTTAFQ